MIQRFCRFATVLSAFIPCAAFAGYVQNFSDWKQAPPELQGSYLQGVLDGWLQGSDRGESSWITARRKGLNKCLSEQKIDHTMLIESVNSHYKAHNADWRLPPSVVLKDVVQGICLADINSERAAIGLDPWERKPAQISKDSP